MRFGRRFVLVAMLLIAARCGYHAAYHWCTPLITLTLPNSYTGYLVVLRKLGRATWAPLKRNYEWHIPSNGVLIVEVDKAFNAWHTLVVKDQSSSLVSKRRRAGGGNSFETHGAAYGDKWVEHWFYYGNAAQRGALLKAIEAELENAE